MYPVRVVLNHKIMPRNETLSIPWKVIAIAAIIVLILVWYRRRQETKAQPVVNRTIVYQSAGPSQNPNPSPDAAYTEYFSSLANGTNTITVTNNISAIVEIQRNGLPLQPTEYSFTGNTITLSVAIGSSPGAQSTNTESLTIKYN